jgi:hypothetical protein
MNRNIDSPASPVATEHRMLTELASAMGTDEVSGEAVRIVTRDLLTAIAHEVIVPSWLRYALDEGELRKTEPNKTLLEAARKGFITVFTDVDQVPLRFMAFRTLNLVHAYPSKMS